MTAAALLMIGKRRVNIVSDSFSDTRTGVATAGLQLRAFGGLYFFYSTPNFQYVYQYEWLLDGSAGDYDVKWHTTNGSLSPLSDAEDTWLQLSSDRQWYVQQSLASGTQTCTGTVQIRDHTTGTVLAEATFTLTATVP